MVAVSRCLACTPGDHVADTLREPASSSSEGKLLRDDEDQTPDVLLGAAVADLLLDRQAWCHRKVVSLRLLEGDRGRQRVSLDCVPPPDPRLAYSPEERGLQSISDVQGRLQIPLAMVRKEVMRDLDVSDAHGAPLLVLGREDDGAAAVAALLHLVNPPAWLEEEVTDLLHRVVFGTGDEAHRAVRFLLGPSTTEHPRGLPWVLELPEVVQDLVLALADAFLLMVLLPAEAAGTRQIVKYSAHWQVEMQGAPGNAIRRTLMRLGAAAGYLAAEHEVEVAGAEDARSYHLEVHAPAGLVCSGLVLPPGPSDDARVVNDRRTGSVAHAVGYYPTGLTSEDTAAVVRLLVTGGGLHLTTWLVALFTATVFVLAEVLPNGRAGLGEATDGAAAILLAAPAVALALLVRTGESDVAGRVLAPLRLVVLACAAALVAAAASLVGQLHEPWATWLWRSCAVGATAVCLLLTLRRPVRAVLVSRAR